jgi:hypothetical protein
MDKRKGYVLLLINAGVRNSVRPHYLDVDTIFGDLRRECLHQRVVRNTIFRKSLPSVVSGYGK